MIWDEDMFLVSEFILYFASLLQPQKAFDHVEYMYVSEDLFATGFLGMERNDFSENKKTATIKQIQRIGPQSL